MARSSSSPSAGPQLTQLRRGGAPLGALALAALLAAAANPVRAASPEPPLQCSSWRLVEIHSMHDAQGISLMADGGMLVWEPLASAGVVYRNTPDPALERAILRAEPGYRRAVLEPEEGLGQARYVHARVDLDGDGREEVFVYLMGPFFCGTGGCNLLLFRPTGRGYAQVADFPISRVPIIVAESSRRGWRDLWRLQSGGGAPPTYVRQVFNGHTYLERERIPADRAPPAGLPVLTGEPTLPDGAVLEPQL